MVTRFGMSDRLGPVALGRQQGNMFLGRDIVANAISQKKQLLLLMMKSASWWK